MKLLLTGLINPFLVLVLFIVASALTVFLYRKHALPKPWNFLLPTLRILTLFLILCTLLQPVIARFGTKRIVGQIPVIIDTSGSMATIDTYAKHRKIELAWSLEFFPKALRNTVFIDEADRWNGLGDALLALEEQVSALKQKPEDEKAIKDLVRAANQMDKQLEKLQDRFTSSIEASDYLKPAGDEKSAFDPTLNVLGEMRTGFTQIAEALKPRKKDAPPLPVADQIKSFAQNMEAWRGIEPRLPELQKLADERLHDAKLPEVDAAAERLAELKRIDLARLALETPPLDILKTLRSKGEVSVYSLDELAEPLESAAFANLEGTLPATRIGSIISRVMNRYEKQPVAGVVLLSDGGNNAGVPVREMREALRDRNIALYPLAIGSEKPPPDVAIAQVVAPQTTFKDDRINLNVALTRNGHTDKPIKLKLLSGEQLLQEQTVPPGDETELVVNLSYAETNAGTRVYRIEAEGFDGEAFSHNNSQSYSVNVLEDRILTLCVDEFPRWETRYANMMLKRDKRVDLDTLFVASTRDGELPMGEGKHVYPDSKEALFKYHILVLGDVNPNHFSTAQMEDIRDFVRVRGGTLIAMAGPHYMPSAYAGTPLADVLPLGRMGRPSETNGVAMDFGNEPLAFKEGLYQPVLAQEGSYEDVLQIGQDPENTFELWNRLPRLSWLKEDVTTARSADPLVEAEAHKGESVTGQAPVMVKAYAGLGKVLYLGSDSFWRWRYRARWTYHHRFWGQILLWSTGGRTTGSDDHVKLMSERPIYAPEETVVLKARLLDEKQLPLANADATIEIFDEARQLVKRQPLFYIENSGGEYRAEIRGLERGAYTMVPKVAELDHVELKAEVPVEVRDLPTSEYIDLALNLQGLEEISTNAVPFEQALSVLEKIEKIDITEELRSDTEVWDTWWYLLLIAGLLALEWMLRKRCKLA
ncbi:MAG: hypothetical protein ACI9QL_002735 [Candidatus Omnitrophota bacterium]|jgi:hypothetical protein